MKKSLIIISLGILLYGFSLFNGFVWDDEAFIRQQALPTRISQLLKPQVYFRPAISALYSILSAPFGPHPFVFHLASVVFHIATALLLLYLFKLFFKESIAFSLSLLFLVHPANVEAVSYASALQEVLFTFIGILGLYFLVRNKIISTITVFISIILATTALLMKETGVVFFALIFVYLILFHRKNTIVIKLYIALAIIAALTYFFVRFSNGIVYLPGGKGLFPIMRVSFFTRFINIPMIIHYYLGMFFFPFNLSIAQHWVVKTTNFKDFWMPLLGNIGIFSILIGGYIYSSFRRSPPIRKTTEKSSPSIPLRVNSTGFNFGLDFSAKPRNDSPKIYLFFFLWFILGLLPHLQIVPLNMTVAERWLYFPMIGLLGMGGALFEQLRIQNLEFRIKNFNSRMTYITIVIVCLLFLRSFTRILDWRNGLALFSSNISPSSSFDLQNNMGVELFRVGKYNEAKRYFEISTRMAPYWWVNWNNLGAAYGREQNYAKAEECYKKSIHNGDYNLAYENMAKSLLRRDKGKAREFANKALQLFPESEILQVVLRDSLK